MNFKLQTTNIGYNKCLLWDNLPITFLGLKAIPCGLEMANHQTILSRLRFNWRSGVLLPSLGDPGGFPDLYFINKKEMKYFDLHWLIFSSQISGFQVWRNPDDKNAFFMIGNLFFCSHWLFHQKPFVRIFDMFFARHSFHESLKCSKVQVWLEI